MKLSDIIDEGVGVRSSVSMKTADEALKNGQTLVVAAPFKVLSKNDKIQVNQGDKLTIIGMGQVGSTKKVLCKFKGKECSFEISSYLNKENGVIDMSMIRIQQK